MNRKIKSGHSGSNLVAQTTSEKKPRWRFLMSKLDPPLYSDCDTPRARTHIEKMEDKIATRLEKDVVRREQ